MMLSMPLQAAPARTPDVVVTAKRAPSVRAVEKQAEAMTPAIDGGYARLAAPVCPEVKGLDAHFAASLEQRMRDDATAAGLPVGAPGCTPNLALVLVDDGQAVVRAALDRKSWLFDGVTPVQLAALAKVAGPARAWSTVKVSGAWGDPLMPGQDNGPPTLAPAFQSRVRLTVAHQIVGSTVLVDRAAADGKTVGQLAGYAMLRGLAGAVPPADPAADTILTLFGGGAPPGGLTAFDLAYLRSLYGGPPNYRYGEKMSGMALTIQRRLADMAPPAAAAGRR
jgi:hypothetical protein